jgi:protein-S-isoprenylcysteine O-methyltransferase Ste14
MITLSLFMTLAKKEEPPPLRAGVSMYFQAGILLSGVLFVMQFLLFMFYYEFSGVVIVRWIGWIFLVAAFLLLTLSKSALKQYGEPEEDKSWAFTTVLVQQGVYRIVRHPFAIGWITMAIGLAFISQYWLSSLGMVIQLPLIVFDMFNEESLNVSKFETEYIDYRKSVPMANLFKGLFRYYSERRKPACSI